MTLHNWYVCDIPPSFEINRWSLGAIKLCIAYYDSKFLKGEFKIENAHRTFCPVCLEPRKIRDPVTKTMVAAKVFYYYLSSISSTLCSVARISFHICCGILERLPKETSGDHVDSSKR